MPSSQYASFSVWSVRCSANPSTPLLSRRDMSPEQNHVGPGDRLQLDSVVLLALGMANVLLTGYSLFLHNRGGG
jgi:hypothetical protein